MTLFLLFSNKKIYFEYFFLSKKLFLKFSRFFGKIQYPSVLRKNFFAPNYNIGYRHGRNFAALRPLFSLKKQLSGRLIETSSAKKF
jgi:hypothetical protein